MEQNNIIGIDLAKQIMHLVEVDSTGKIISKLKKSREELLPFLATLDKSTLIAMEACNGCNYFAQQISKQGFNVVLKKTKDVQCYARSKQKNDWNDALAITKAARDPELKTVRAKNKEEQDVSFLHKTRMNTIRDRVHKTNSMMSSLEEYGYITNYKKNKFCMDCKNEVKAAYAEKHINKQVYEVLLIDCAEISMLCEKERAIDKMINALNKQNKKAIKLANIMGIGPINASSLSIAPMESYKTARDFSASLGLVPQQHTSGDKIMLGGITKHGNRYARTMLIQAGRTIAMRAKKDQASNNRLVLWARKKFSENKPYNVICVGLANKLARIAYSVIINNTEYIGV